MNRLTTKLMIAGLALGSLLVFAAPAPQAPAAAPAAQKAAKAAPKPAPTEAEIADAKAKNLVWVNLNTKKYHKSDNAMYGHTKNGQFMTEEDAQKMGAKAAQEPQPKGAKKGAAPTATPK